MILFNCGHAIWLAFCTPGASIFGATLLFLPPKVPLVRTWTFTVEHVVLANASSLWPTCERTSDKRYCYSATQHLGQGYDTRPGTSANVWDYLTIFNTTTSKTRFYGGMFASLVALEPLAQFTCYFWASFRRLIARNMGETWWNKRRFGHLFFGSSAILGPSHVFGHWNSSTWWTLDSWRIVEEF